MKLFIFISLVNHQNFYEKIFRFTKVRRVCRSTRRAYSNVLAYYTIEQVDFNVAAQARIQRAPSLSVELKGFAPLPLPRIVFETIVSSIPPKLHIFNYIIIILQYFLLVKKISNLITKLFIKYFHNSSMLTLTLLNNIYMIYHISNNWIIFYKSI